MNTFCVQPWFSKEINDSTETPCCWLEKNADIDQVKKDLLNGVRSSACNKCWKAEDSNNKSRRQQQNELLDYWYDRDIRFIQQDVIQGNYTTLIYQIKTSNVCNGACVTCGPSASSKWNSLLKQQSQDSNNRVLDIDYENAVSIEILGGEPFLESKNLQILENLLENNNTKCFVSFVTNGTVLPTRFYDVLKNFKNISICLSIDGVGKVFDYMRYPLKWEKLIENLPKFKETAKFLSVSYTESNINQIYRQQTIDWLTQNNLPYILNTVIDPVCFSGAVTQATIDALNFQDQLKNINRKDFIPEWVDKYE